MPTRISAVPESREWKQAYLAAILEKNRSRVNHLIHDARQKLSTRLRELTPESLHSDEIEAIHDAEYLLQALQSSLLYREDWEN